MAFAKIRQFITASASLLSTQLSKLESNLDAEFLSIRDETLQSFSPILKAPTSAPFSSTLQIGQLLNCAESLVAQKVVLERPSGANAGKVAALIKGGSSVTVTVAAPLQGRTQGTINQISSLGLVTFGLNLFISDGKDWWTPQ